MAGGYCQLVAAYGKFAEPGLQRGGAHQAAGEAAEDRVEIDGSEPKGDRPGQRLGGMLANRGGEHGAIADEPSDNGDDTADAAGSDAEGARLIGLRGGSGWGRGRGGASVSRTGVGLEGRGDRKL